MLASETFHRFLESPASIEMINKLRQREVAGEQLPCRTCAAGVNPQSETFWLEIFRNMSETVSIGMVVSDMTVPGCALVHINEGFRATTGYGKEKIGCNSKFLQGVGTEIYLVEEIMAALQQSEPLITKLHNHKANGQKYQNLLALHPVFGPVPDNEYKFVIGMQVDFNNQDPDLPRKLMEMGRILRLLPQAMGGEQLPGVEKALAELESMCGGQASGGMGMGGGGMGMGGGMGGFSPAPPGGPAPSFGSPRPF